MVQRGGMARQHDRSRSWIVAEAIRRYAASEEQCSARDDLGLPLAAIIIGLAIFGLAGGCWLSWLWWKRFGHRA